MSTPEPEVAHAPITEVKALVPTERIASFYALVGAWLRDPDAARAPRRRSVGGRRRKGPSASRYAPIGEHLAGLKKDAATLTFEQVEDLIDGKLPGSAHKHRAWWANTDTHSQALTWISKGWLVQQADLDAGKVTFRRA